MAENQDVINSLYNNISSDYELPEFEVFKADMADPAKAQKLHETLATDGYDVPDFETFTADLGLKKKDGTTDSSPEAGPLPSASPSVGTNEDPSDPIFKLLKNKKQALRNKSNRPVVVAQVDMSAMDASFDEKINTANDELKKKAKTLGIDENDLDSIYTDFNTIDNIDLSDAEVMDLYKVRKEKPVTYSRRLGNLQWIDAVRGNINSFGDKALAEQSLGELDAFVQEVRQGSYGEGSYKATLEKAARAFDFIKRMTADNNAAYDKAVNGFKKDLGPALGRALASDPSAVTAMRDGGNDFATQLGLDFFSVIDKPYSDQSKAALAADFTDPNAKSAKQRRASDIENAGLNLISAGVNDYAEANGEQLQAANNFYEANKPRLEEIKKEITDIKAAPEDDDARLLTSTMRLYSTELERFKGYKKTVDSGKATKDEIQEYNYSANLLNNMAKRVNTLAQRQENPELASKIQEYNTLVDQFKNYGSSIDNGNKVSQWVNYVNQKRDTQFSRYPVKALDQELEDFQNIMGSNTNDLQKGVINVSSFGENSLDFFENIYQSIFYSDDEKLESDFSKVGKRDFERRLINFETQDQSLRQRPVITVASPELRAQLDKIEANADLTKEQKYMQTSKLVREGRANGQVYDATNPKAGEYNITAKTVSSTIASVLPQLLTQYGFTAATGGLGAVSKLKTLGSLAMSTALQGYSDYYKDGVEQGLANPNGYALSHTLVDVFSEVLFTNDLKVLQETARGMKGVGAEFIRNLTQAEFDAIKKGSKNAFKSWGKAAKEGIKSNLEESVLEEGILAQGGGNIVDRELFQMPTNPLDDVEETSIKMSLGMLPMTALGIPMSVRKANLGNKLQMYNVGVDPASSIEAVKEMLDNNELTQPEADARIAMINSLHKIVKEIPKTYADGNPLRDIDKAKVAFNQLIINQSKVNAQSVPEAQAVEIKKAADAAAAENAKILGSSFAKPLSKIESAKATDFTAAPVSEGFAEKMQQAKDSIGANGISVDVYNQEDYDKIAKEGGQFVTNQDGTAMGVLKPNGEMVSLVKSSENTQKNVAPAMLEKMKQLGGLFMDNFDIYLTKQYEKAGFKVVARLPFNEEFAPEGWQDSPLKDKPDVVFMAREDIAPAEEKAFTDYDEAKAYTEGLVNQAVTEGKAKLPTTITAEFADKKIAEANKNQPQVEKLQQALEATGVKVEIVDDLAGQTGQQGIGGVFIAEDGKILLDKASLENEQKAGRIIFHEGAHPVMNILRNTNKDLYDAVVAGVKEAAEKNPMLAKAITWAEKNYNDQGEEVVNDEAVVEVVAMIADGTLDINTIPEGWKQQLIDFINKIAKVLGLPEVSATNMKQFKDTASKVAEALREGRDVAEIVGKENVTETQNEIPSIMASGEMKNTPQAKILGSEPLGIYEGKEVANLPIKSLLDLFRKFGGRATVINSDPTRVGELTLPSGKKIFMYGGPAYLALKQNVEGSIGFATTQISKVNSWLKYVKELFGDEKGLTLIGTQAPTSMMANSYALRYVLDAISTLPKSVLKSKEFKDEFFGKDLVLLKDAFGEKGYNDFVAKYKKADLSDPAVIDGMIAEMAYKVGDDNQPASFKARGAFVSNLLGGIALKSEIKGVEGDKGYVSKKPTKFIAKQLFDRLGLNQEKLFYELGEKSLVDLYMNEGKWGMAVAGFETDPKLTVAEVQTGGVKHPLFNSKFPGKNAFLLDGAYDLDQLFTPQQIISSNGNPYTKKASQMLAGSMYVKGGQEETEKVFKYNEASPVGTRIQARRMAPNGKPSNLDEKQYQQVRTPEFKAWFGDWENDPENASKVVDENGEPRVIFHGTNVKFDQFDKSKLGSKNWMADSAYTGFFFAGDEKTSQAYVGINNADLMGLSLAQSPILTNATEKYKSELEAANKAIENVSQKELAKDRKKYEEFLAPIVAKLREEGVLPESAISELYSRRQIDKSVFERINSLNEENGNNKRLRDINNKIFDEVQAAWMKEKGLEPIILNLYLNVKNPLVIDFENNESEEGLTRNIEVAKLNGNDGVVFKNLADGGDVDDIFVAFEPNQIKSATDNSGAFSKTDNRIQARKSTDLVEEAGLTKQMTQDDQGNYLFYHYSPKKLKTIDPSKFGSNTRATGRDERPGVGISMYYTRPNDREANVPNDFGYVVRVPQNKVYPFNEDPLELLDEAEKQFKKQYPTQAFDFNKQVGFVAKVAAEKGYPMTVAKWDGKLRAQTTEALTPENYSKIKPGTMNQVEINPELEKFKPGKKYQARAEEEEMEDRGFSKTFDQRDPSVIAQISNNAKKYFAISNKQTAEEVNRFIEGENPEDVLNYLLAEPRDIPARVRIWMSGVIMDKIDEAIVEAKKNKDDKEAERLAEKQAQLINQISPLATELGQAVQAFRRFYENSKGSAAMFNYFFNNLVSKIEKQAERKLTKEELADLEELAKELQEAPKGLPKDEAAFELGNYIGGITPTSAVDILQAIWYAHILSGVTTQSTNFFANLWNTFSEGVVTGIRESIKSKSLMPFALGMKGFLDGASMGLTEGADILATGITGDGDGGKYMSQNLLEYFDWKSTKVGKLGGGRVGKLLNIAGSWSPKLLKYVGRALAATDAAFARSNTEAIARMMAYTQAKQEGAKDVMGRVREILFNTQQNIADASQQATDEGFVKGTRRFKRRVYEIMEEQRGDEFNQKTEDYGKKVTLNYEPEGFTRPLYLAALAVQNSSKFARLFVPFTRIIANLTENSLNYTPLGAVKAVVGSTSSSEGRRRLTKDERADFAIKSMIGISTFIVLAGLTGDDDDDMFDITANGSGNLQKNYELRKSGWRPYSIKLKSGRYISYKDWPIMPILAAIGAMHDAKKYRKDEITNDAMVAMHGMVNSLYDKSVMTGIQDFVEIFKPKAEYNENTNVAERVVSYAADQASTMLVSNFNKQNVKLIQEAMDSPVRSAKGVQRIYRDIPFLNNGLNPILDVFGEPVMPNTSERLLPITVKKVSKDEMLAALNENGIFIGKPQTRDVLIEDEEAEGGYTPTPMTDQEYYAYTKRAGQLTKEYLEEYWDDFEEILAIEDREERIKSLQKATNKIVTAARKQAMDLFYE